MSELQTELVDFFTKMGYCDPYHPDLRDKLRLISEGKIAFVMKQLIDTVKPKDYVREVKMNIILNAMLGDQSALRKHYPFKLQEIEAMQRVENKREEVEKRRGKVQELREQLDGLQEKTGHNCVDLHSLRNEETELQLKLSVFKLKRHELAAKKREAEETMLKLGAVEKDNGFQRNMRLYHEEICEIIENQASSFCTKFNKQCPAHLKAKLESAVIINKLQYLHNMADFKRKQKEIETQKTCIESQIREKFGPDNEKISTIMEYVASQSLYFGLNAALSKADDQIISLKRQLSQCKLTVDLGMELKHAENEIEKCVKLLEDRQNETLQMDENLRLIRDEYLALNGAENAKLSLDCEGIDSKGYGKAIEVIKKFPFHLSKRSRGLEQSFEDLKSLVAQNHDLCPIIPNPVLCLSANLRLACDRIAWLEILNSEKVVQAFPDYEKGAIKPVEIGSSSLLRKYQFLRSDMETLKQSLWEVDYLINFWFKMPISKYIKFNYKFEGKSLQDYERILNDLGNVMGQ